MVEINAAKFISGGIVLKYYLFSRTRHKVTIKQLMQVDEATDIVNCKFNSCKLPRKCGRRQYVGIILMKQVGEDMKYVNKESGYRICGFKKKELTPEEVKLRLLACGGI